MVKFAAKTKEETKGNGALRDPEIRKKFKSALATITHYFQQIDDQKEGVKETIADMAVEYGLDKKIIRKLAVILYKHDYATRLEEEQHFQALYEMIIEGKLRDPAGSGDPLDRAIDEAIDEDVDDAE